MKGLKMTVMLTLGLAICIAASSQAEDYGFVAEVRGEGPPMVLIPGLNTPGEVWAEVEAHYRGRYQTHTLTLKGFAGEPMTAEPSLEAVKNGLLAYLQDKQLNKPVLVGHSLGGFLSLWVASDAPKSVGKLVIVDSLPFFPLIFNPAATEASMEPMARQQTQGIASASVEGRRQYYQGSVPGLVTSEEDARRITGWGVASDPAMTAQSMYTMFTTDLRDDLARIEVPTLVLGSWYSAKNFGGTIDSVKAQFSMQYEHLPEVEIVMHEQARHFIMLDDPQWTMEKVDGFLH